MRILPGHAFPAAATRFGLTNPHHPGSSSRTFLSVAKSKQKEGNTAARRSGSRRRYGKGAGKTVASAMRRRKRGTLRSGKGGKGGRVTSRKQAIAIGLSEARKKGAKVPRKRSS
jgi:hypothetical protein